jgi:hypothetical protein
VILTRSPLGLHQCCHRLDLVRLACVRHAASVRPEPGSNSPSRSASRPGGHGDDRRAGSGLATPHRLAQHRLLSVTVLVNCLVQPSGTSKRAARLPALAFGSHCSVFKERRDTHPDRVEVSIPAVSLPTGGPSSYSHLPGVSKVPGPGTNRAGPPPGTGPVIDPDRPTAPPAPTPAPGQAPTRAPHRHPPRRRVRHPPGPAASARRGDHPAPTTATAGSWPSGSRCGPTPPASPAEAPRRR